MAVAIAAVLALSIGVVQAWDEPVSRRESTLTGALGTDGKLVLRVMAPTLY
ncbi:hypothetical protein AB3M93_18050 [Novosphingobium panipatense]|uniref:hypothetical protein n=1 Tax=Novosphingobium TaxID=165696 RepID=UPI001304DD07|nr:hypothetical protein [Novosphingobium sp. HII-3]